MGLLARENAVRVGYFKEIFAVGGYKDRASGQGGVDVLKDVFKVRSVQQAGNRVLFFFICRQRRHVVKQIVDAFPIEGMIAALVDSNFFQVYDDLFTFREFENGLGLYRNHILHVWQTIGYSTLVNSVAFIVSEDMNSDGDIADEYTVTYTLKTGVTSTNKRKTVLEGTTYKTTLKGVEAGDTVTVTVGGVTDAGAYDSDTGVVKISKVEGNIVITVA